ncbi:MAG: prolyl oligopeptidase family serine peptidase [Emergencia timonensis]|uniref:S9 family peptidase n=1 Tax=Emergencia timonensis TaxID=1776384 RepID=UPI000A4E80FD|nr:S9 family peptidase [Emergencia timonensis]
MKRRLEIEDLLRYRFLSSLKASENKKHCVFNVHQANLEKNGYDSDLYLYDAQTEGIRRLTDSGSAGSAIWLDQSHVLFASKEDLGAEPGKPVTEYFVMDIDSGESQFYMRIPAEVNWISDLGGGKFACLAKSYIPDEGGPEPKTAEKETWYHEERDYIIADELPFRQDGMGITNGMRYRVFVYDRKEDTLNAVSDKWQNVESINAKDGKIIFSARKFQKTEPYLFYGDVEVYDSSTGVLDVLMDDHTYRVYGVDFIGGEPVFIGTRGLQHGYQNENSSFYRFGKAGEPERFCYNDRSVSNTVGTDVKYGGVTEYIADEEGVYYLSTEEGDAVIKLAGLDGNIETVSCEEGSVDDFALLDGKIIYAGLHENRPQELYLLREGETVRVSSFNSEIADTCTRSRPVAITFPGREMSLTGFVIKPVGFEEEKAEAESYPSILYIHGGHKCAFGPVFFHEMQVWANRGFFVIYCNPRGSDGRDDCFADVIGRYGFYEEADLLAFRDACLKAYPAMDPQRMGIGGGSYGGFLTNWMISRTDCFKCAVSQRGIASWNGMFFTSDTNYLFPCWSFENDVWMDPERYWQHSPLKYAENCHTPTLFIHAENDYRCPVSEGISMFQALKFKGIEARLCIFKGESHGLSRSGKPRSRIKRLKEMTNWYEKHLQP